MISGQNIKLNLKYILEIRLWKKGKTVLGHTRLSIFIGDSLSSIHFFTHSVTQSVSDVFALIPKLVNIS